MADNSSGLGLLLLLGAFAYSMSGSDKPTDQSEDSSSYSASADDSGDDESASKDDSDQADDSDDGDHEEFDEDDAKQEAERDLANSTYESSSMAYGCTQDCSGHNAGWDWRAQHGYSTAGNSQSFDEGGRAFDEAVERKVEEKRSEWEEEHGEE